MKVDLVYPKIPENSDKFHGKCIAFEKLDGTNLHWIWNIHDGWHLFGTRRTQFPLTKNGIADFSKEHYELQNAPLIFNDKLRDALSVYLCQHISYAHEKVILFTEFLGPNSFAGNHSEQDVADDTQDLVIIDVSRRNKIISPNKMIKDFANFNHAKVIFTGKYSGQFAEDVRKGKYNLNEGVVCKSVYDDYEDEEQLFMTKIKTNDYLKRLQKR